LSRYFFIAISLFYGVFFSSCGYKGNTLFLINSSYNKYFPDNGYIEDIIADSLIRKGYSVDYLDHYSYNAAGMVIKTLISDKQPDIIVTNNFLFPVLIKDDTNYQYPLKFITFGFNMPITNNRTDHCICNIIPDAGIFADTIISEMAKINKIEQYEEILFVMQENDTFSIEVYSHIKNNYPQISQYLLTNQSQRNINQRIQNKNKIVIFSGMEMNRVIGEINIDSEILVYGIELITDFGRYSNSIKKQFYIDTRLGVLEFLNSDNYDDFINKDSAEEKILNYIFTDRYCYAFRNM